MTFQTLSKSGGTKKRGWAVWGASFVAKILKTEVYIGKWYYRKTDHNKEEWLAIDVPPLIDEETWYQVRKIGERNKALARASRQFQYLLTGHIRCGLCGSRMHGPPGYWKSKNAKGYNFYYRCTGHDGTIANVNCPIPQFRLEQVDAAVWEWVTSFLTDPQLLEQGMAEYQAAQEVKNERVIERVAIIDELLEDQQQQLNRILDLYLEGDFPKELLVEKKRRLEETIRSLESERLDLKDFVEKKSLSLEQFQDIQEFSRRILEGINLLSCDFETRRKIIELLDIQVVCMLDDEGTKYVNLICILGSDQYALSTNTRVQTLGG